MTASTRHSWSEKHRLQFTTSRACWRCGMVEMVHHQHEGPRDMIWTEYWRDGNCERGDGRVPACDGRNEKGVNQGAAAGDAALSGHPGNVGAATGAQSHAG